MTAPALDIRGLHVRYGDVTALDGCSLTVESGRVTGLIGMNGSGKSTLFKAVMGAVKANAGGVTVHGGDPAAARAASRVAYVPQSEDIDRDFPVSVRDVVTMGRYGRMGFTRRATARDRAAVDEALARVDLTDLADRQIGQALRWPTQARLRRPRHRAGGLPPAPRRTLRRRRQTIRGHHRDATAGACRRRTCRPGLDARPPRSPRARG
ncbi:hypothetical protein GCM10025876_16560 [Demequina litorisediminis]|uniref:ABC transporter domain-containing protein n=1 Tax=Demequina litorisediminis TaxID=1849022 RepID=A0ABQ6IFD1_9MICO|nr:hypothetical protein GCM10025876_16560 [Demequina litorisediminis]